MKSDNYTFGKCLRCGKMTALKNGYCVDCFLMTKNDDGVIDFFKNMFNMEN